MGFLDSGIIVYAIEYDAKGRDMGETTLVLKEGKKDGVYLIKPGNMLGSYELVKTFDPANASVYREIDGANKSVIGRAAAGYVLAGAAGGIIGGLSGQGKKDAWYLEIEEKDGTCTVLRAKNKNEAEKFVKRILKHA